MSLAEITSRVQRLVVEKLHLSVPCADTDMIAGGLLDSLALVDLLVHLEKEFSVKIELGDLEIENFRSIGAIARFVAGRRSSVAEVV